MDETPYGLAYGHKAVIPAEIGILSSRVINFYPQNNDENLRHNLDLLKGKRECALICQAKYKAVTTRYYNAKCETPSYR